MALFLIAYAITGGAMAYFCGVRTPFTVAVTVVFWPMVAAFVLIDAAMDKGA